MQWPNIWAPWRIDYIRGVSKDRDEEPACFLCEAWRQPERDEANLVVHRSAAGLIMMNRFPYTNGHLMVAPGHHVGDLVDLAPAERASLMELTVLAERLIQAVLNPQGMNVGVNVGRSAGAGLPGHVHVHIVPRWGGDTNFMHVVGQVRVNPQSLEQLYGQFVQTLPALPAGTEAVT